MSVRKTIKRQYQGIVDRAALQLSAVQKPPEGWVATVRKALGMSGAQLARRLGVSRASVSQTEKNELSGSVTLKHMQSTAEALGCRFVYAIVPVGPTEDLIRDQAERKATKLVRRASGHMALESQSLPLEKNKEEIARLCDELIRDMPSDFWEER
ncbi:mobile mystery protein A [Pelagibius sp. Alg239-R121]|uniref:mobile mystery protein A n=1 Tax=Pelagibius sp. Alg239-R121 TaxID=2993448 RepID=UPI0024A72757|nr:mobile mystery protein A [Pelagibius sp. Alg239-R121]